MPAKTITATIPPGLARFSTAATWRSVLATAPDRSVQEILMHRCVGHPPPGGPPVAPWQRLAHRAAENPFNRQGPPWWRPFVVGRTRGASLPVNRLERRVGGLRVWRHHPP